MSAPHILCFLFLSAATHGKVAIDLAAFGIVLDMEILSEACLNVNMI